MKAVTIVATRAKRGGNAREMEAPRQYSRAATVGNQEERGIVLIESTMHDEFSGEGELVAKDKIFVRMPIADKNDTTMPRVRVICCDLRRLSPRQLSQEHLQDHSNLRVCIAAVIFTLVIQLDACCHSALFTSSSSRVCFPIHDTDHFCWTLARR